MDFSKSIVLLVLSGHMWILHDNQTLQHTAHQFLIMLLQQQIQTKQGMDTDFKK